MNVTVWVWVALREDFLEDAMLRLKPGTLASISQADGPASKAEGGGGAFDDGERSSGGGPHHRACKVPRRQNACLGNCNKNGNSNHSFIHLKMYFSTYYVPDLMLNQRINS